MHKNDYHIGCLSGTITRADKSLKGEMKRIGAELSGTIARVGQTLTGNISLICTTSKDSFLHVDPDYVWLTPEMLSGEFDIYSNVSWRID